MGVEQNYVTNEEDGNQFGRGRKTIRQFTKDVQARLALEKETKEEYVTRLTKELCAMLHLRKEVVQDAIAYQKKTGGACMRSDAYDNFSTPSRDKRIKLVLDQVFEALFRVPIFVSTEKKVARVSHYMQSCLSIKLGNGQTLSIEEALMGLARKRWSSDPNQTELARWGLEPASRKCPKP
jgi:hypothetical protein